MSKACKLHFFFLLVLISNNVFCLYSYSAPPSPKNLRASDTIELKTVPDLAYLPHYTGKSPKFLQCHYYPKMQSNQCYLMRYLTKEPAEMVIQWYEQALKQYGWDLKSEQSKSTKVVAEMKNKGLHLIVSTSKSANPSYRSSLEIRYMDFHPPTIMPSGQ